LSVMYFDLNHPPPRIAAQLRRVGGMLNLTQSAYQRADVPIYQQPKPGPARIHSNGA
jgi:hypothetical protein